MAFKLVTRNKLRVPVKGSIADENGKPVPFSFVLLCDRITQSRVTEVLEDKDMKSTDFLQDVTNGWEGVLDANGQPIPFSAESFAEVMEQVGLPTVCFQAYLKEVAAAPKN